MVYWTNFIPLYSVKNIENYLLEYSFTSAHSKHIIERQAQFYSLIIRFYNSVLEVSNLTQPLW